MNINDFKIPTPFQLSMDDIGWIEGRTPYWDGFQPTRSGIPRRHVLEDYKAVNEIGKIANMKISGMFVLGDWDTDGILKNVTCATKLGKNWMGSPCVNVEEQEEIRDFLNSCTHLEMAVHGLMHEAWDENGNYIHAEFVPCKDFRLGNKAEPAPEWYVREHFDAFMEIYNRWGFKQELRDFTCPGHCFDAWKEGIYTKILNDYGIKFWHEPHITHTFTDNGVVLGNEAGFLAFWEAYDINPDKLPTYTEETAGIICSHWPNFLRLDPDLNLERIDKWKAFFNRQSEVFGVILSCDIAFAHYQLLYKNHCVVSQEDDKIKIDFSKVDEYAPHGFDEPLYISVKNDVPLFECIGGIMTEYESHKEFKNYKIERKNQNVIYLKHIVK